MNLNKNGYRLQEEKKENGTPSANERPDGGTFHLTKFVLEMITFCGKESLLKKQVG